MVVIVSKIGRIYLGFLFLFLILSQAIKANPAKDSQALTHYIMAGVYESRDDFDRAISEYKKALKIDYTCASLHYKLACAYIQKRNFDNAIDELNLAIKYKPDALESYFLLTLIYSLQKKYDLATQEYEKFLKHATELNPRNIELYKRLGEIYLEQNNLEFAEKIYKIILGLSPEDARVHFVLGMIYERQAKIDQAIEHFRAAIELNADDHISLNALGYLYAQQGLKLDQAEVMIKKALEFQPDNGAYVDSLGWVYFKKGKIDLAIKELQRAANLSEDPIIFNHLAEAYFTKSDLIKAQESWQKSLELDATQLNIEEKIKNIKNMQLSR